MASEEEVVILVRLAGTTAFIRDSGAASGAVRELGIATEETGLAMGRTTRRSYLMNQAMFTLRRLMYGVTLGVIAAGGAALKMGFSFNSAMQQARVALEPVSAEIGGVNKELAYLYNFTKYTPFQFKDVTIAFRQMYLGMRTVGITGDQVNRTLKAITDALAATGRTSPGALNRVAVALQHMAFQGHLTGYSVNQLARDGIPIFAALRQELGLTGEELHNVGALGIPTAKVLDAINRYIESTPGYANAAYRQATGSLSGLFTTFKDNVAQLMGNMETGVFHRFQQRLVAFNAFFDRFTKSMQQHASFSSLIGQALGGGAEFIWKQFAADISLAWHIFTGFMRDVFKSKGVWFTIASALILLRVVLWPINFAVQHFGWLLTVLVPLMAAWVAWQKLNAMWLVITKALVIDNTVALKDMTFAQLLLTRAQKALVAATWLWDAALLANPITWIVLGVVALTAGLVVLYLKWRAFHNAVNATVSFLWHHPLLAMFVPVIGPLIVLAKTFEAIYKHLRDIYNLVRHPLHVFGGGGSSFLHGLENFGRSFLPFGGHLPFGLASGGTLTSGGSVIVGEQGPELLTLPPAATVQPLGFASAGGGGQPQRFEINLNVGQRQLESVILDIINGRIATA